jgi:hypothetical protein
MENIIVIEYIIKWQNDLNINKSRQHSVNSKVNYAWNSAINGLGIIIL